MALGDLEPVGHRRLFHRLLGTVLHRLPGGRVLWQLHVAGGVPRVLLARLLQLGSQPVHLRPLFARLPLRLHQLPALRVRAHAQRAGEPGERPHDGSSADDDDADSGAHGQRRRRLQQSGRHQRADAVGVTMPTQVRAAPAVERNLSA